MSRKAASAASAASVWIWTVRHNLSARHLCRTRHSQRQYNQPRWPPSSSATRCLHDRMTYIYIYIYRTWGVGATRPGRFRTKSASSRAPSGNSLTVRELPDPARELREQIPELPVGPRVVRFRVTPKPSTEIYTYIYICVFCFKNIYIYNPSAPACGKLQKGHVKEVS